MTRTEPQSNYQRALIGLRELIFSGELTAGSDHLETELAERMGMSRTPVREALLTLESQGLVKVRPRRGVRIVPVSAEDMREIYEVLTELESLAAENAARAGYHETELVALANAIDAMDMALKQQDLVAWAAADERFHAELVRLGGNTRIETIVDRMQDQVRRARASTLYIRPKPLQSNEDHRAVYRAIREGNATSARARHRAHRQEAKATLIALLDKHQLKGL